MKKNPTINIEKIIRKNIRDLEAYSCARQEFSGQGQVFLDANENPFATGYNRYPDPTHRALRELLAQIKGVRPEQMVLGNGSDELIDLLIRITCTPGEDNIVFFTPGYAMYAICAAVNGVEAREVWLDENFLPDWTKLQERVDDRTRLIFCCTPNNPVGNLIPVEEIVAWAARFDGLVVVDEAYIDFSEGESAVKNIGSHPNLVVLQTLSKAWGMAGLRIGICMADPVLITYINRVKYPYNINSLSQQMALKALEQRKETDRQIRLIREERERLFCALRELNCFDRVYPSQANFILVTLKAYRELYDYLLENGVVVRLRHIPLRLPGGVRITVGTPEENRCLINLIVGFNGGVG